MKLLKKKIYIELKIGAGERKGGPRGCVGGSFFSVEARTLGAPLGSNKCLLVDAGTLFVERVYTGLLLTVVDWFPDVV